MWDIVLPFDIQLSREEGWDPITQFNPVSYSKPSA